MFLSEHSKFLDLASTFEESKSLHHERLQNLDSSNINIKSRNLQTSDVSIFTFEESTFLDLVDFGDAASSVESDSV